jgi:hypothetical protein
LEGIERELLVGEGGGFTVLWTEKVGKVVTAEVVPGGGACASSFAKFARNGSLKREGRSNSHETIGEIGNPVHYSFI